MASAVAPRSILALIRLLYLMMSPSLWVRSSSFRTPVSLRTEGRMQGGGTGRTVQIIHSGRLNLGQNPRASESSSVMRRRMRRTSSALKTWRLTLPFCASNGCCWLF